MPTLAKRIVDENALGVNPHVNFKGFAVGNPYTNPYSGTPVSRQSPSRLSRMKLVSNRQ